MEGYCCIFWIKNNYVIDKYCNIVSISNFMSICILRECMVVCIGDLDCMFVGYDEGNCLCYVYNKLFILKLVSFVDILGW